MSRRSRMGIARPLLVLLGLILAASGHVAAQTTIVFADWGGQIQAEAAHRAIALFEREHPGIKVEFIQAGAGAYPDRLRTMIAAGTPPDVMRIQDPDIFDFYMAGHMLDLTPLIERDGYDLSDFFDLRLTEYQGARYALPRGGGGNHVHVTFYNRDAFNEAGLAQLTFDRDNPANNWTWDDLLEYARKLTRSEGDGVTSRWGFDFLRARYFDWVWSNGGEILDDSATQLLLSQEPALEALEWLSDLISVYGVTSPAENVAGFATGEVAMLYANNPRISSYRDTLAFDWGIVGTPRGKAGAVGMAQFLSMGISVDSREVDAAWEFLKFMVSPEIVRMESVEYNLWAPSRISVGLDAEFLFPSGPPYDLSPIIAGEARHRPTWAYNWPEVERRLQAALAPVWSGQTSARQAIAGVENEVNALLSAR